MEDQLEVSASFSGKIMDPQFLIAVILPTMFLILVLAMKFSISREDRQQTTMDLPLDFYTLSSGLLLDVVRKIGSSGSIEIAVALLILYTLFLLWEINLNKNSKGNWETHRAMSIGQFLLAFLISAFVYLFIIALWVKGMG